MSNFDTDTVRNRSDSYAYGSDFYSVRNGSDFYSVSYSVRNGSDSYSYNHR
jgi:hypothetical protein